MSTPPTLTLIGMGSELIAGLGLFFAGIRMLSDSLRRLADHRLHTMISSATRSGRSAAALGFVGGAIMQSMNAMVFVLTSLVKAGVLDVRRAHPIINYANLGSSVLVLLSAFKPKMFILFLTGITGILFYSDRDRSATAQDVIHAIFGIALLFVGLSFIKDLGAAVGSLGLLAGVFSESAQSFLLAFVAGAGIAFLIHSASSVTIVTMAIASSGAIDLQHAMLTVYGAGLGAAGSTLLLGAGHHGYARQLILYQFSLKVLGLVVMLPLAGVEFFYDIPLLAAGVDGLPGGAALHIALVYLAYQVACDLVMHPLHHRVAQHIETRAPQTVAEELGQLRYVYPGAEKDPGTALVLVEQEQLRLIEYLPGYLDRVRADAGTAERDRASLHRGCVQLTRACERFLGGLLASSPGAESLGRALLLQNRNQILAGLQESLNELGAEGERIPGWSEGEPGVLMDALLESLHLLLLTLQDAVRSADPEDLAVLQTLTGDRSEMMHGIRSGLLASTDMPAATRDSLLNATSLFERLVWLLRRYSVLLTPAEEKAQG